MYSFTWDKSLWEGRAVGSLNWSLLVFGLAIWAAIAT